jgi:hypothetical protein
MTGTADERNATLSDEIIHVTRVQNGGVYGHAVAGCDAAGCAGFEVYYPTLRPDDVARGDLYRLTDDGPVRVDAA